MGKVSRSRKATEKTHATGVRAAAFHRFTELQTGQPVDVAEELEYLGSLHEGQWSCVLKVRDRASNTVRALKVMRPELVADERLQGAFVAEAERAAAASTGVAARLYGVGPLHTAIGEPADWWAVSLEWLDGRSLRELIWGGQEARPLSLGGLAEKAAEGAGAPASGLLAEQAFGFAEKAAAGIAELHKAGLLHLDIRPEHLLLTRKNALRVIGHGLAAELRRHGDEVLGVGWRASAYAAPEIALGEWDRLGPATDVYSLAVVTYELFAAATCSPWIGYEELCESVDYLAPDLDELIQDCLGPPERRPSDAGIFLGRLRAAARTFEENRRRNRTRPERKAREIWTRAQALAAGGDVPWGYVAGMCRRLVEEKPHLLPFGKIPIGQVRELLDRAEKELKRMRRSHLDALIAARAWTVVAALVERWRGDVSVAEADDLRLSVEMARLADAGRDPQGRAVAYQRVIEVLKEPQLDTAQRQRASAMLEELAHAPVAAAALPLPVVTDLGVLPPVERWRVETDGESATWRVVVGPALRLGRGSWDEFGNHVDLRPTRREAAESSITIALAQRLSRAGHLEFRVGADGLEAFCLGTHGAVFDGKHIQRGQRVALADEGTFNLAEGATAGTYRLWRGRDGVVIAADLAITGGVGVGRRVAWVLAALPTRMLAGEESAAGLLIPTPEGWFVQAEEEGLKLSTQALPPGARVRWPEESALRLSATCRVTRG
jgi:serine/threonine protein kinase